MKLNLNSCSCSCDKCKNMCAKSTCLPTPDETRSLIKAGYGDRLATYTFEGQQFIGPAPKGKEGKRGLCHTLEGCTFFNNGKCDLHDLGLKPLEGKLAHHDRDWLPIRIHVMGYWKGKRFESVFKTFMNHVSS